MHAQLVVDDIDLSDSAFWALPLDQRDQAFATLRAERPIAFFDDPPEFVELLKMSPGPGYYAVTRHADVRAASRLPEVFRSAQGATNIYDLPPEFLEFFGSMINLDDPRHLRLRRIRSRPRRPQVPAGRDKLLLFYNSANRDEDVFDDPFRFDVRRHPNDHLGFGGFGPHHCLGAHLARQEIAVVFGEMLRRTPDIHPVGEPQRLFSSFINGVKHILCEFTPGPKAA